VFKSDTTPPLSPAINNKNAKRKKTMEEKEKKEKTIKKKIK
jgi:hypothetical protein